MAVACNAANRLKNHNGLLAQFLAFCFFLINGEASKRNLSNHQPILYFQRISMERPKLNLLTMSVATRLALAIGLLAVLWLVIAWALGWLSGNSGGVR